MQTVTKQIRNTTVTITTTTLENNTNDVKNGSKKSGDT